MFDEEYDFMLSHLEIQSEYLGGICDGIRSLLNSGCEDHLHDPGC